jgi:hypothetical protein
MLGVTPALTAVMDVKSSAFDCNAFDVCKWRRPVVLASVMTNAVPGDTTDDVMPLEAATVMDGAIWALALLMSSIVKTVSLSWGIVWALATVSTKVPVCCVQTPDDPNTDAFRPCTGRTSVLIVCVPMMFVMVTVAPVPSVVLGRSVMVSTFLALCVLLFSTTVAVVQNADVAAAVSTEPLIRVAGIVTLPDASAYGIAGC